MDYLRKGCFFHIITEILKFVVVYYIFGVVALMAIFFSLSIVSTIENNTSQTIFSLIENGGNGYEIITQVINRITDSAPFNGLFELLIDNEGSIISGLIDFFTNLLNEEIIVPAWKLYLPKLLRDVTVTTLASLIFFVFSRLNRMLSIFRGFTAQFAFIIVSVLWYFASYCCSDCLLKIIEYYNIPQNWNTLYILIILISLFLHALLLGYSVEMGKSRIPRALLVLGIEVPFCALNALLLWLLKTTLFGLFRLFNGSAVFIFVCVAFCLKFLEDIKSLILAKSTFTLFTIFQKSEKSF